MRKGSSNITLIKQLGTSILIGLGGALIILNRSCVDWQPRHHAGGLLSVGNKYVLHDVLGR